MRSPYSSVVLAVLVIVSVLGCGKGEYDKLVSSRIDQLQNPHKHGILIWQEHVEPELGYTVSMPKADEEVKRDEGEAVTTESRELVFGSTRYRFRFWQYKVNTDPQPIATAIEKQYRDLGYEDIPEEEGSVSSVSGSIKTLNLRHPDEATGRARVEVVAFGQRKVCSMEVLGVDLSDEHSDKFFRSAKGSVPRPRRRR